LLQQKTRKVTKHAPEDLMLTSFQQPRLLAHRLQKKGKGKLILLALYHSTALSKKWSLMQ
jgi:hypothetical protein